MPLHWNYQENFNKHILVLVLEVNKVNELDIQTCILQENKMYG